MQIFELNYANKSSTLLVESVCRDLTRDQRRIVEGIVSELRPLFETTLSADQIQQIFQQAQEKQAASGGGRTAIGRAVDTTKAVGSAVGTAAGAVNKAIDGLGRYLQTTAPVQYFDQKFEDLKQKISAKLGADSKTMAVIDQLGQYAKANPGKTAFVIGTLTAVAALTTGPAGGAVAGQVLRGATELLKGEKLSTAVGKGAKSAALGALAGAGAKELGSMLSGTVQAVADQLHPGVDRLILNWRNLGGTVAKFDVRGLPQDLEPIQTAWRNARAAYSSGNIDGAVNYLLQADQLVDKISTPEYISKLSTEIADQQKWQAGANAFKKAVDGAVAAAQGAVTATTAKTPATPAATTNTAPAAGSQVKEGYTRLTNKEIREIFAIAGGQLTEGPTWDKIKSIGSKVAKTMTTKQVAANLLKSWEKSGKPDDSGIIADILHDNNVSDDIIQDIYNAMNIELVTPAGRYRPPAQPAAATATQPAAATATQPAADKVTAAPAMNTDQILKSYEMMSSAERTQLIKDLEIIDDRDRLATGTNESRNRQRRI
jgi:hypothetical protein